MQHDPAGAIAYWQRFRLMGEALADMLQKGTPERAGTPARAKRACTENKLSDYEFGFRIDGDVFIRHQKVGSVDDLIRMLTKYPRTMALELGGPFVHARYSDVYAPGECPLRFDLDLSDYDDVRPCCSKKRCCNKCWLFVRAGLALIRMSMQEAFGLGDEMCAVFSGRRGAHFYCNGSHARSLSRQERSAIASYLGVVYTRSETRAGVRTAAKLDVRILERVTMTRELSILLPYAALAIRTYGWLWFFDLIRPRSQKKNVMRLAKRVCGETATKSTLEKVRSVCERRNLGVAFDRAVYLALYPRIDTAVTTDLTHLCKAPFSVHPATGLLALPFDDCPGADADPSHVWLPERDALGLDDFVVDPMCVYASLALFRRRLCDVAHPRWIRPSLRTGPVRPLPKRPDWNSRVGWRPHYEGHSDPGQPPIRKRKRVHKEDARVRKRLRDK